MKLKLVVFFLLFGAAKFATVGQTPDFLNYLHHPWVDSLMNTLTLDQKIGQLFMIQAYSNGKNQSVDEVVSQVNQYQVGGILFMQGGPVAQAKICNKLQQNSHIPLLIALDGETGLGFRLDSTISYPVQMALGAIANDSLIYRMGLEAAHQFRRMGIHMNMAPVCDINSDPENPVIGFRSFGENKDLVARKAWMYAKGLQDGGVIATAKHFPGHGDTKIDSHYNLPVIGYTRNRLDSVEFAPFAYLIRQGIAAVMTGHLQVPSIEPADNTPATLSKKIIGKTLRDKMNFNGLVISDAMNMKALSNLYPSAESAVKALAAGNDMLEVMPRLDRAIEAVRQAVKSGEISKDEIDLKCRKILAVKKWLELDHIKLVNPEHLVEALNQPGYLLTKRLLQEQSITVLTNQKDLLPLQRLDTLKIASLTVGGPTGISPLQTMMENYTTVDHFHLAKDAGDPDIDRLMTQLAPYNLLVVGLQGTSMYPRNNFGISEPQRKIAKMLSSPKTIICFFGNPYALNYLPNLYQANSLIVTYQDDPDVQELTAELIFGATGTNAKLPVSLGEAFPAGSGIDLRPIQRLKYTLPEEANIDSRYLQEKVDSMANLGLTAKAYPGCQVLIAKDGKVILQKSYGYLSYDEEIPVQNTDLYDLASVTKVTTGLPAVMKMYDEKRIKLDVPFSNYFEEFKNTNKSEMTVRDVLTHQSRLQSGIPFWLEPGSQTKLRSKAFRTQPSAKYQVRVSANLYARNDIKSLMIQDIIKSPLRARKEYVYSDLGFSLFPTIIERLTHENFQEYLSREFYKPLGATTTGYKPYEKFPLDQIAPTENDQYFRKELLRGFVHDELAAMFGGISGNAGLFSSANDLAKIMQMYLQNGYYGGRQYISSATVKEFTKLQNPLGNHRSLGFAKPNPGISGEKNTFPAPDANPESYGHSGFTGTFVWNDPVNQLVFIFLSNRVNPTRLNSKLFDLNIRTEMQQVIYDALKKGRSDY